MKLRVRGNSLRLRLTRPEIDALGRGERVEDAVDFGPSLGGRLVYAVVPDSAAGDVMARFDGREIVVRVPAPLARVWTTTEQVGIEADVASGGASPLRVLLEKDFACLKPREGEDDADAFPHPSGAHVCD